MNHDPGVEEAEVGRAFELQGGNRRQHDFTHDAVMHFGRDDRRRRIRAHAASVGAFVGIAQALVVL